MLYLSCETLYMHIMDIQTASSISNMGASSASASSWVSDEPSAYYESCSIDSFFCDLQFRLRNCKQLRLLESNWVFSGALRTRVESLLAKFTSDGGKIEVVNRIVEKKAVSEE